MISNLEYSGLMKRAAVNAKTLISSLAKAIGMGHEGERIARELVKSGVRSRAALRRPAVLSRLPKVAQANVLYSHTGRVPLEEADAVVNELKKRVEFCPSNGAEAKCLKLPLVAVGSVRRRAPTVKDFDMMVFLPASKAKGDFSAVLPSLRLAGSGRASIARVYNAGARKFSFVLLWKSGASSRHFRVDVFLALARDKPYALYHYTGSKIYNLRTRALAKKRGWLLNQYGLFDRKTRARVPGTEKIKTERDLMKFLGVHYRTPAERNE
jgi:DNA polymerase (family 10)